MSATVENMLQLKRDYLIPCVYHFYQQPMVLERGEGVHLFDQDGNVYLDAYSGVGVVNCGHCNPDIAAATGKQLARLQHTTSIYLTEPVLRLAERLAAFVPGKLRRSFFCSSGSEANERALLLARLATGRKEFIALSRALHGGTYMTSALTGLEFWRTDPFMPDTVHFTPSPVCRECPFQLQPADCDLRCAQEIETVLEQNPGKIAAFFAEPIHGNGGIVAPPAGFYPRVKRILEKHGVLLVMDEAQTGFCRTGDRFGFQGAGVEPDIITLCKALGNGMPIAAMMTSDELAKAWIRPGAATFGGNPVGATTALAVLEYMETHALEQNARRMGALLHGKLKELQQKFSLIAEVRGRGLMLGMELVDAQGEPASAQMDQILEELKNIGILAGKTGPGRNVLTLMPPLVIEEKDIEFLCQGLEHAFGKVS